MRHKHRLFLVLVLLGPLSIADAQAQSDATALLATLSTAISGGTPFHGAILTGEVTRYSGNTEDSGPATLTVDAEGNMQFIATLSKQGSRTETFTAGSGLGQCSWAGSDGVAHKLSGRTCWKPVSTFLPAISLQPSLLLSGVAAADLGNGPVGSAGAIYRHLQAQLVSSLIPLAMATQLMGDSAVDLGLDTETFLPAVLTYTVHPDDGTSTLIPLEFHYSAYQKVQGTQIPFLIDRYINGAHQLSFVVSSAQIN